MAMARGRRVSKSNDLWIGWGLILLGLLLSVSLGGIYWWAKHRHEPLDKNTNCPLSGPREVHVILFDRTDPILPQQAQRIRQRMQQLRDSAAFGKRFDLYTVEGDSRSVLNPIRSICSPNRPEDANILIENPEFIRKKYQEDFVSVLDKTIDDLLQNSTRNVSPIIESMKAASITSFGPFEARNIPFRLTIISDMVQHTPAHSHFRSEPNFSALQKSDAWRSVRPNLFNAQVNVLYLLREEARRGGVPIQNRGHQEFWVQVVGASNGRFVSEPEPAFEPM
jgi:hypothetical protein